MTTLAARIPDSIIHGLKAAYDGKTAEARELHHEFAKARELMVKEAGGKVDGDGNFSVQLPAQKLLELNGLKQKVEAAEGEAEEMRSALFAGLNGRKGGLRPATAGGETTGSEWLRKMTAEHGAKALTEVVSGSTLVSSFVEQFIREFPQRNARILSLIPSTSIDGSQAEFLKQTVATQAAAETALSAAKPESTYTLEKVVAIARTIAHVVTGVPRQWLADHDQLEKFLDSQMALGVVLRLESQIISGDGVGENLRGILNTTGIGSVAKGGTEPAIEALMRGITTVRLADMEPTAVSIHPSDYEEIRLMKTADGDYAAAPITSADPPSLLGLPAVVSRAMPVGTALVGDWETGTQLWDRQEASIKMSEEHDTHFTRNQVAFRAEGRWAFGVPRLSALCAVTGI